MFHVKFPGFGIEFDVSRIAFRVGEFRVYWYGILIATGFLLAVIYAAVRCKEFKIKREPLTDCIICGLITAIIGARAYYVIFKWDVYKNDLPSIIRIDQGGLAIYGGIIGALIGGLIMARIFRVRAFALLDLTALGFLIGQGIGRWGNFTNQEAFGTPTDNIFRMVSERTEGIAVHPCFLYESVWCLLGFVLLHFISKKYRKFDGQIFYMYLVWYGAERMVVESLRTDSLYLPFGNIRVSQLLSAVLVVFGLAMLIIKFRKIKRSERAKVLRS